MAKVTAGARAALILAFAAQVVLAADSKPVATVGSVSVSASELSRRLAQIPDFQRAALGDSPDKLERSVLDTRIIPELLFGQEGARLKLDQRPALRAREREILRQALEHALSRESAQKTPVTNDDIKAYFEANRARFETPRRIRVWRILTDDEALARKIIADCQGVDGIKRWSQYARENSLDTATQFRDGDLGFVHEDGKTDAPTLRVDPVLFTSADQLADGALAKEPLKEGAHWAVIWRRGSAAAITRTVAQEQGSIRQVLERERIAKAREALLADLRAKYVSAQNDALLETVRFDVEGAPARETHARAAHAAAAGSALPRADRDLR